jgi:FkbM family methyltransferase
VASGARPRMRGAMQATTFAEAIVLIAAMRDEVRKPSTDEYVAFMAFCLANVSRSHAQFLQDMWVAYELGAKRDGFFVEFGAADGVHASNSLYLERDLGWSGIVAEPARIWQPRLQANRKCFVDERCVWVRSGEELVFNQPAIALHSTIDSYSNSDMHGDTRVEGERYPVQTVSLMDLLAHWKAPRRIDYLSIDTEGSELDILQAFDFSAYEIGLISVEHNYTDKRGDLFDLLVANGFRRKFDKLSNVDDWYVRA